MAIDGVAVDLTLSLERDDGVADVRRLDVSPVQIGGVAPDSEIELGRETFPQRGEGVVEAANRFAFRAQRPRPRDDLDDRVDHRGDQPVEWRRQVRHAHGATRQRLHEARDEMRLRPMQPIDHAAWLFGRAEREDGTAVAIPGTNERFVEPLSIALGRDHRTRAPRAVDLHTLQRQTNGQRRVLADDSRAFAGDPDARLSGRVVRVAAMLPVPSKTNRFSSVGAVRASIKRVYAAAIVGTEAVDVGHDAERLRLLYDAA